MGCVDTIRLITRGSYWSRIRDLGHLPWQIPLSLIRLHYSISRTFSLYQDLIGISEIWICVPWMFSLRLPLNWCVFSLFRYTIWLSFSFLLVLSLSPSSLSLPLFGRSLSQNFYLLPPVLGSLWCLRRALFLSFVKRESWRPPSDRNDCTIKVGSHYLDPKG